MKKDSIERKARAKVNLALHVTGQRADGYHLLDSLVTFADIGDVIRLERAGRACGDHTLSIIGPFSRGLSSEPDNLVLRAARLMGDDLPALDIVLEKNLPVASGIGGGSADAAATLCAISALLERTMPGSDALLTLGADVPVCVNGQTARMEGIGETIKPLGAAPDYAMVLANPGVAVSTPAVFRSLARKNNTPLAMIEYGGDLKAEGFLAMIKRNRNDLQQAAVKLAPEIAICLTALANTQEMLVHRMSGSGATCFALYSRPLDAENAVRALKARFPHWWVVATSIA